MTDEKGRMSDTAPEDIDELLERHRQLRGQLPHVFDAFFARFGRLRPIQEAAIPKILSGVDVLLSAPTAGGKTEAVAAPACENARRERWPGLSIVMITPTRALVNDLFERLERPCHDLGIRLARKTADHPFSRNSGAHFLITTPESLESLLTFRRECLEDLRTVIIDEVHLLDGTPRGDQLCFLLRRLRALLRHRRGREDPGLQTIGISATLANPRSTARRYLKEEAELVAVAGQRAIQAEIVLANLDDDESRAAAAVAGAERFEEVHKVLIFVNSRQQADQARLYARGAFARLPVFGHHGSLSKEERERTEARFRSEPRAICVATMTLEVGIDIGDVDLVICMDPPFTLASFLQRTGRGCRRLQGITRVLCVARNHADRLIFEALIDQAGRGMPAVPEPPLRRSVVLQQSLAYLRQVPGQRRTEEQFINAFGATATPPLAALIRETLLDMTANGLLSLRNGVYEPGSEGREFIESSRVYCNISASAEVALVDADTGRPVAKVAGLETAAGGVRIAGRSFELLPGGGGGVQKVRATGEFHGTPRYATRSLPYGTDVGFALARRLEIPSGTVLAIDVESGLMLMTWLGKLLNLTLAALLRLQGFKCKPRAFGLLIPLPAAGAVLSALRDALDDPPIISPLRNQRVESAADLGPYFETLTVEGQAAARADFFHGADLRDWLAELSRCEVVERGTRLDEELRWLAEK